MVLGEWIVHVISFQKILSSCGLNGHIMEIRLGVTLEDNGQRTDNGRNVKIELEFWTQNSQFNHNLLLLTIILLTAFRTWPQNFSFLFTFRLSLSSLPVVYLTSKMSSRTGPKSIDLNIRMKARLCRGQFQVGSKYCTAN